MRTLVFLLMIGLVIGCKEKVAIELSQLQGRWNVNKALRNGKETITMQSAYFMFPNDKSVISNLINNEESTTFTLSGNKLSMGDFVFEVEEFDGSNMKMSGKINEFDLELYLRKE